MGIGLKSCVAVYLLNWSESSSNTSEKHLPTGVVLDDGGTDEKERQRDVAQRG